MRRACCKPSVLGTMTSNQNGVPTKRTQSKKNLLQAGVQGETTCALSTPHLHVSAPTLHARLSPKKTHRVLHNFVSLLPLHSHVPPPFFFSLAQIPPSASSLTAGMNSDDVEGAPGWRQERCISSLGPKPKHRQRQGATQTRTCYFAGFVIFIRCHAVR
jgi:hypothetical protein